MEGLAHSFIFYGEEKAREEVVGPEGLEPPTNPL